MFFLGAYLFGMSLLEGKSVKESAENVKSKFWYGLKCNWLLWPAANLVNFGLVPVKFQVLYYNFISMFWNMFLSYIQNTPAAGSKSESKVAAKTPAQK